MPEPRAVDRHSLHPCSPQAEAELVRGVKAGNERALETLLHRNWAGLVRYAFQFVESRDEAEDIAQEAFVRLWTRRETWRQKESLRPVLYQITRRLALNEKRRTATSRRWALALHRSERDPSPTPHRELERADLQAAVEEAVESLSERRREIFVLVRIHRMTYAEAGEVLGIAPQTVGNLLAKAMEDLREILGPRLRTAKAEQVPFSNAP